MSSQAPPSSSLMKWALPVGLFVVIVGAIAFVSQNLPKGVIKQAGGGSGGKKDDRSPDLRFKYGVGLWDDNDPTYAKEFEMGKEGHYDFPFFNPNPYAVTLLFSRASCDCSTVKVAVLDTAAAAKVQAIEKPTPTALEGDTLQWTALTRNDTEGVRIPPESWGLARLEWHGRKTPRDSLRINIQLTMFPAGRPDDRLFVDLMVPVMMSEAVRFFPDRLSLGVLGPGGVESGEMLAWSPTRPNLDLKIDPAKTDSLFEATAVKLDAKAAEALRARMQKAALNRIDSTEHRKNAEAQFAKDNRETRLLSAYQVKVTLREQKDKDQLDQGHFSRPLPIVVDAPCNPPIVAAGIRGDVEVGDVDDGGKINLKTFPAKSGIKRTILIGSQGDVDLVVESTYPKALDVKLTRDAKASTAARGRWRLDVSIAPGAWYGPFSDDATIVLRTNTTPPRRIRIPVTGNAGHG